MIREEMIDVLYDYCNHRPHTIENCISCPIRRPMSNGCICQNIHSRSDEELAVDFAKIATMPEKEEIRPYDKMVKINRDELRVIEGKLTMLSTCKGSTITEKMADELLFIAERICMSISNHDGEGENQ